VRLLHQFQSLCNNVDIIRPTSVSIDGRWRRCRQHPPQWQLRRRWRHSNAEQKGRPCQYQEQWCYCSHGNSWLRSLGFNWRYDLARVFRSFDGATHFRFTGSNQLRKMSIGTPWDSLPIVSVSSTWMTCHVTRYVVNATRRLITCHIVEQTGWRVMSAYSGVPLVSFVN